MGRGDGTAGDRLGQGRIGPVAAPGDDGWPGAQASCPPLSPGGSAIRTDPHTPSRVRERREGNGSGNGRRDGAAVNGLRAGRFALLAAGGTGIRTDPHTATRVRAGRVRKRSVTSRGRRDSLSRAVAAARRSSVRSTHRASPRQYGSTACRKGSRPSSTASYRKSALRGNGPGSSLRPGRAAARKTWKTWSRNGTSAVRVMAGDISERAGYIFEKRGSCGRNGKRLKLDVAGSRAPRTGNGQAAGNVRGGTAAQGFGATIAATPGRLKPGLAKEWQNTYKLIIICNKPRVNQGRFAGSDPRRILMESSQS